MQYLKKKNNLYGNRAEGGIAEDDRFSLEKMKLDRNDQGVAGDFDPFFKGNVRSEVIILLET